MDESDTYVFSPQFGSGPYLLSKVVKTPPRLSHTQNVSLLLFLTLKYIGEFLQYIILSYSQVSWIGDPATKINSSSFKNETCF